MTVDEFANVLRDPNTRLEEDNFYVSDTTGNTGYKATFSRHGLWYWFSISSRTHPMSAKDVADAITHPHRSIAREGSFKRRGFEATVYSGPHWYMLGHGDNRPTGLEGN
jgi:hypothetical protein